MRLFKIIRLASRDYFHEWQMSGCFALALAAVLGPMLVLFGLKFGIIGGMLEQLIEDPANREIRPVGSGHHDIAWLDALRKRPDVAFLVPRTRSIAATLQLRSDKAGRILDAEMIPSDHNDPLLHGLGVTPEGLRRIVLSHSAAQKLKVQAGDIIDGSLARRYQGRRERVHLPLEVVAVAPESAFARDGAFVDLVLLEALEDFRDGHAVPALGWKGVPPPEQRSYPGFRLYARSIYDVAPLKALLAEQGIDVRTRAADIELVMKMDRNLSAIYWAIAIIGLVGFSLSLGASLWANVDRKRRELSVLRLVGFRTGDIVWFPVVQAFYTAVFGWGLAIVIYRGAAWAINDMLSDQLADGQQVCVLLPEHYAWALGLTVTAAVLAAALAGLRSARIEPSEGLREL
ncbi:ABC transporter permease [endosymbiont of unidentified scaly snail isolate Monju]|uniref:ABC transporter permease n=1 Tax=endosymbiont of unidentified scaly snail isolate Monju TaxID=1248727 RepID=UPI0003892033|nr:ABC transporter permease [endosymbiont of unidentified scaly snail isolate Monju]BAN68348.1 ABC transporter permease [endosymbiont of unidentified scaly snail isolate Monju]